MSLFNDHPTSRFTKDDARQWHFRDYPTKGQTLVVEFCPLNYPEIGVWIEDNKQAQHTKTEALRELGYKEVK
jgi:hypothetical protein